MAKRRDVVAALMELLPQENPQDGNDTGLLLILTGLRLYASGYAARFGSPIGGDYVLGPEWAGVVQGLRGLLNGPMDTVDPGDIEQALWKIAERNKVDLEEDPDRWGDLRKAFPWHKDEPINGGDLIDWISARMPTPKEEEA